MRETLPTLAADRPIRPPWTRNRIQLPILTAVAIGLVVIAALETGVSPARLFESVDSVRSLVRRMWPPVTFEWRRYLDAMWVTFFMVIAGTGLAALISVPFAILSARNTTLGRTWFALARGVIVFTRAVPSIVWALLFVRAIGIGPMAGVMALAVNSLGMLGKLFADSIEEVDKGQVDAMISNGASRSQVFVSGILPQTFPSWISLTLYRLDLNVRRAIILGFVGAGGIGLELQRVLGQLVYTRALTIIAMIFVFIVVIEQISAWARRLIVGVEATSGLPTGGAKTRRQPVHDPESGNRRSAIPNFRGGPVRPPWTMTRASKVLGAAGGVGLVLVSLVVVGVTPANFVRSLLALGEVMGRMIPPDFLTNWEGIAEQMLETVWIAVAATAFGMAIALPVAILAARNTAPNRVVSGLARLTMLVQRGIPELILAVLFVVAVGLGPFAGVLALTVGAVGFSGKLLADGFENISNKGMIGLSAVGANWWQRVWAGFIPQATPMIVGIGIYTLDVYIRAATILGIVGAGGIGGILNSTIQSHAFDRTLAIIILIFVVIYGFERFSSWLRNQLI